MFSVLAPKRLSLAKMRPGQTLTTLACATVR